MKRIAAVVIALIMAMSLCVSAAEEGPAFSGEVLKIMTETVGTAYSYFEDEEEIKEAFLKVWGVSNSADASQEDINAAGFTAYYLMNYIQNKNSKVEDLSIKDVYDLSQTILNGDYFDRMSEQNKPSFALKKLIAEAEAMTKPDSKAAEARVEAVKKELLDICVNAAKDFSLSFSTQIPESYAEFASKNYGKKLDVATIESLFGTISQFFRESIIEVSKLGEETWDYVTRATAYANAVLLSDNASGEDVNAAYQAAFFAVVAMSTEDSREVLISAEGKSLLLNFAETVFGDEYGRVVENSAAETAEGLIERVKTADDEDATEMLYMLTVQAARDIVDTEISKLSGVSPVPWLGLTGGFEDVNVKDWSYPAIYLITQNNLMPGAEDKIFDKQSSMKTGEFLAILRAFSEGAVPGDVEGGTEWAKENKILNNADEINMTDGITREQAAEAIYNMFKNYELANSTGTCSYADMEETSENAREAMCWAMESGVLKGGGDGKLLPKTVLTRECAAQLMLNTVYYLNGLQVY